MCKCAHLCVCMPVTVRVPVHYIFFMYKGLTVLVLFVCFMVYLLCTHLYTVNCYNVSNCETVGSVVVIMSSAGLHVFLNAVACHYIL